MPFTWGMIFCVGMLVRIWDILCGNYFGKGLRMCAELCVFVRFCVTVFIWVILRDVFGKYLACVFGAHFGTIFCERIWERFREVFWIFCMRIRMIFRDVFGGYVACVCGGYFGTYLDDMLHVYPESV